MMLGVLIKLFLFISFFVVIPQLFGEVKAQQISVEPPKISNGNPAPVVIKAVNLKAGENYIFDTPGGGGTIRVFSAKADVNGEITFRLCASGAGGYNTNDSCNSNTHPLLEKAYEISLHEALPKKFLAKTILEVYVEITGTIEFKNTSFKTTDNIVINVDIPDGSYIIRIIYPDGKTEDPRHMEEHTACRDAREGKGITDYNIGKYYEGSHTVQIYTNRKSLTNPICGIGTLVAGRTFTISNAGAGGPGATVGVGSTTPTSSVTAKICMDNNTDPTFDARFHTVCAKSGGTPCDNDPKNPGFQTAIGCIHTNPTELVKDFLKFAVAISGGLAFLMMLFGAFQMLTSAGNPDTLNAGREILTSAIIGLLFVIFSILLMQVIGVDILGIPGFK